MNKKDKALLTRLEKELDRIIKNGGNGKLDMKLKKISSRMLIKIGRSKRKKEIESNRIS